MLGTPLRCRELSLLSLLSLLSRACVLAMRAATAATGRALELPPLADLAGADDCDDHVQSAGSAVSPCIARRRSHKVRCFRFCSLQCQRQRWPTTPADRCQRLSCCLQPRRHLMAAIAHGAATAHGAAAAPGRKRRWLGGDTKRLAANFTALDTWTNAGVCVRMRRCNPSANKRAR